MERNGNGRGIKVVETVTGGASSSAYHPLVYLKTLLCLELYCSLFLCYCRRYQNSDVIRSNEGKQNINAKAY
jgi:hypothetical protein